MRTNLTETQNDYAVFLPAVSSFYGSFIGYQRHRYPYVKPERIPQNFVNDVESINFLDSKNGLFYYKWSLYSAGHANIDEKRELEDDRESLFRERRKRQNFNDENFTLGDSGGFQIGKGKWEGDWKDPNCPKAQKKRHDVLKWMDRNMDYGMILDIPAWVARSPEGAKATGISTYEDAVKATKYNNEYFINNRTGACKFLNVLQGENHTDADKWYEEMKDFCDPTIYPKNHFNGWAMGGQNMCDVHLVLKRIVTLHFDGLLQEGKHDWMHFLGTSKLEWAVLLTDIQRAVRKYYNPNFTISFDCASPFLSTANGQMYNETLTEDRTKWTYRMLPALDNKKYSNDTGRFIDECINSGKFKYVENSPVLDGVKVNDVCVYSPTDVNRMGKTTKTSWDSFTYAILMAHNVWMHLSAVQQANEQYDNGIIPKMLVDEKFDTILFRNVIDDIFKLDNKDDALALIEYYTRFWMQIPGTRGAVGRKTLNAQTMFGKYFEEEERPLEDTVRFDEGASPEDIESSLE